MKCPNCGYENRERARFCQGCGEALKSQPASSGVEKTKPLEAKSHSSATGSDTQPLPGASAAFAPLPVGALLDDGRYVVIEERAANESLNRYLVEGTVPVRLCPNCVAEAANSEERFCTFCGADLSGVELRYLNYRMKESAGDRAFAVEAQLLQKELEHPGLLLPRDVFLEAPYGPPRQYMVESESRLPLASALSVPRELYRVLEWGVMLARALDYVHRHRVALCEVGLDHIAVDDGAARWVYMGGSCVDPQEAPRHFARDVQGLAASLLYLATGQQRHTSDLSLPDHVAAPLSRALTRPGEFTASAFASALESALEKVRRPEGVTFIVGSRTDVGQERSLNEDSLLTLDLTSVFRSASTSVGLFAVADGMGGHEAGDMASRVTIRAVTQRAIGEVLAPAASGESLPSAGEWLTRAVQQTNRMIYEQRQAASTDMGTTLLLALVVGDRATIANVGDSRAYLLDQEGIVQITTDHSLVERLLATGQITPEEAVDHPKRSVIYRVMGDKSHLEVDLFERNLSFGEALLLCSDGLTGMVPDEQIWQIWRTSISPQEACDRLVEAANRAGGEDNITVVIVQVSR